MNPDDFRLIEHLDRLKGSAQALAFARIPSHEQIIDEIKRTLAGNKMFDQVHEMVTTGQIKGDVGKLAVFAGVHKFPARVKCAILAWHAVMAALKGDAKPVTTESEEI